MTAPLALLIALLQPAPADPAPARSLGDDAPPMAEQRYRIGVKLNCLTTLGRGVTFDVAAEADGPSYTSSGWPDPDATETDARGLGLFFNIETGEDGSLATVRASIDGEPIGETQVRLRPGYLTSTTVWPASTTSF